MLICALYKSVSTAGLRVILRSGVGFALWGAKYGYHFSNILYLRISVFRRGGRDVGPNRSAAVRGRKESFVERLKQIG
jgi:hypothetical protein